MSTPMNTNFLHTNDFLVSFTKFPNVAFFAQRLSLPGISMGTKQQATPIMPFDRPSGRLQFEPLVVTFKVDEDLSNWMQVHKWLITVGGLHDDPAALKNMLMNEVGAEFSDVTVTTMTNRMNKGKTFRFRNAWPENLSGIEFSTTDSETTYSDATMTLRYAYYDLET